MASTISIRSPAVLSGVATPLSVVRGKSSTAGSLTSRTIPILADAHASRAPKAALTIQRAWRNTRSGIALLQKQRDSLNSDAMSELPHKIFQKVCTRLLKPLLQKGLNPKRQEMIETAIEEFRARRDAYQSRWFIPLCTSLNNNGVLPACHLTTDTDLSAYRRFADGSFYLTPVAHEQFEKHPQSPLKTIRELDTFVQALSEKTDLLPWSYTLNGCYARAQVVIDLLILSGIPKEDISLQYTVIPESFRIENDLLSWDYHVAPLVKLADGTTCVVDPVLSPDRALSVEAWIERQKRPSASLSSMTIDNRGVLKTTGPGALVVKHNPSQCLVFTTAANIKLLDDIDSDADEFRLGAFSDTDKIACLKTLATNRSKIERCWLRTLTKTPL